MSDNIFQNREIFFNSDIMSVISQNFDFLSISGRVDMLYMLQNIPEISGLPPEVRDEKIREIFRSRMAYNKSLYEFTILENEDPDIFSYTFAVVYPKGSEKPIIINERNMIDKASINGLENVGAHIKGGILWSLNGPAGKITFGNGRKQKIYCNDRERYHIQIFNKNGVLVRENWYKCGKLDRGNDLPAEIRYTGNIVTFRGWFRNGKIHRDGAPAMIAYYPDTGNIELEEYYQNSIEYRNNGLPHTIVYTNTIPPEIIEEIRD